MALLVLCLLGMTSSTTAGGFLHVPTMITWVKRRMMRQGPIASPEGRVEAPPRTAPPSAAGPAEYLPLHKYLTDRYANTVVLRLTEIEDLLGFALPDLARLQPAWWANTHTGGAPSVQSLSWTQASRTATPNLLARTVIFERTLD